MLSSLLVILAMGVGSSAAVAKSGGQDERSHRLTSAKWVKKASVWHKCLRDAQSQLTRVKRIETKAKYRLILRHCALAHGTVPQKPIEVPEPKPTPKPTDPKPTEPKPTEPTPTEPTPETPPVTGGVATEANTGVPSGTKLTASGGLSITKDGTVVDGKDIKGDIWIDADNVTIKNSRIVGSGFSVVQIKNGRTGVKIQNVEIDGAGRTSGAMGVMGPADVSGADITGVENGLTPGSGSTLTGNYIHGLKSPGSPHYDGIQIDGGLSNIKIERNLVDMREHGQTSAVMIDNYFGSIKNISVNNNVLMGGGYTVYSDGQFNGGSISGVSFTNNKMGKGQYGYASIVDNTVLWSGNTDFTTSKAISSK